MARHGLSAADYPKAFHDFGKQGYRLKVVSGETDFAKVATLRWDGAVAKKRMARLLAGHQDRLAGTVKLLFQPAESPRTLPKSSWVVGG